MKIAPSVLASLLLTGCAIGMAGLFSKSPYKVWGLDPLTSSLKRDKGKDVIPVTKVAPGEYVCIKANELEAYINKSRVGKTR